MGSIRVYFKRLDISNGTYFHEFIIWQNDAGQETFLRGGPSPLSLQHGGGSGSSGFGIVSRGVDVPFEAIWVQTGTYVPNSIDYAAPGTDPYQTIISGSDKQLQPYFQRMLDERDIINKADIAYSVAGPNSNSVITSLLHAAGLPEPKNNDLSGTTPAPGADIPTLEAKYSVLGEDTKLIQNALSRTSMDLQNLASHVERSIEQNIENNAIDDVIRNSGALTLLRALKAAGANHETPEAEFAAMRKAFLAIARANALSVVPIKRRPGGTEKPAAAVHSSAVAEPTHADDGELPPHILALYHATRAVGEQLGLAKLREAGRHILPPKYTLPQWMQDLQSRTAAHELPSFAPAHGVSSILAGLATARALGAVGRAFRGNNTLEMSFVPIPGHNAPADYVPSDRRSFGHAPSPQAASLHHSTPAAPPRSMSQEDFRAQLHEHLNREARLPPNGATGFDPRLSPAWPGQKLPN